MSEVREARFRDLVKGEIRPVSMGFYRVGTRSALLDEVRAELDVVAEQVERGCFEDREIARLALAGAVARLVEIDRDFYRETRP